MVFSVYTVRGVNHDRQTDRRTDRHMKRLKIWYPSSGRIVLDTIYQNIDQLLNRGSSNNRPSRQYVNSGIFARLTYFLSFDLLFLTVDPIFSLRPTYWRLKYILYLDLLFYIWPSFNLWLVFLLLDLTHFLTWPTFWPETHFFTRDPIFDLRPIYALWPTFDPRSTFWHETHFFTRDPIFDLRPIYALWPTFDPRSTFWPETHFLTWDPLFHQRPNRVTSLTKRPHAEQLNLV